MVCLTLKIIGVVWLGVTSKFDICKEVMHAVNFTMTDINIHRHWYHIGATIMQSQSVAKFQRKLMRKRYSSTALAFQQERCHLIHHYKEICSAFQHCLGPGARQHFSKNGFLRTRSSIVLISMSSIYDSTLTMRGVSNIFQSLKSATHTLK